MEGRTLQKTNTSANALPPAQQVRILDLSPVQVPSADVHVSLTCAGLHAALFGWVVVLVSSAASVYEHLTVSCLSVVVPVPQRCSAGTCFRLHLAVL